MLKLPLKIKLSIFAFPKLMVIAGMGAWVGFVNWTCWFDENELKLGPEEDVCLGILGTELELSIWSETRLEPGNEGIPTGKSRISSFGLVLTAFPAA